VRSPGSDPQKTGDDAELEPAGNDECEDSGQPERDRSEEKSGSAPTSESVKVQLQAGGKNQVEQACRAKSRDKTFTIEHTEPAGADEDATEDEPDNARKPNAPRKRTGGGGDQAEHR
jgi:hypothetical protein